MKTHKLIIVGDSAFAEIAMEYFSLDSNYQVVGFSVERSFLKRDQLHGLPVVPFEDIQTYFDPKTHHIYVAIVYSQLNRLRARLASKAKAFGYQLASYVSSRAFVWRNVELGEHCFIFEGNTLQPYARIEDNVVLWSGNHIGHHSIIRSNCFIASHVVVSGFCDVGENSFIGVNATLSNNITIGADNWIGPNITIMKDTYSGALFSSRQPDPSRISALKFFKIHE